MAEQSIVKTVGEMSSQDDLRKFFGRTPHVVQSILGPTNRSNHNLDLTMNRYRLAEVHGENFVKTYETGMNSRPVDFLSHVIKYVADPAFPLVLVLVWFPLWWILGLVEPVIFVATVIMAWRLLRRRHIEVVAGFGWWVLFLVIAALGILVTQVHAPGTEFGFSANRYMTWALRMVWYLEVTVVLLYLINFRRQVTPKRIARILSSMFIVIVVGGLLGTIFPTIVFPSVVELVLPHGITSNGFVKSLVHPYLAQQQEYLGVVTYRPSGPFPYANSWGFAFGCFLPFFVYAWFGPEAKWRRFVAPLILGAAIPPVVYSSNRGLWALLIVMAIVTMVRHIRSGHFRTTIVGSIIVIIVVTIIIISPLAGAFEARFNSHNSNEGRANLQTAAVISMAKSSPLIGLGTTRDVQGNFYSIADGRTPQCPSCGSPPFGTQGMMWLLLYANGFAGAFCALAFFVGSVWRTRKHKSSTSLACRLTLMMFLFTLIIYDFTLIAMFAVMAAIAILSGNEETSSGFHATRLGDTTHVWKIRLKGFVVASCVGTGLIMGTMWQVNRGTTYIGSVSILSPTPPKDSRLSAGRQSTLDTESQYIRSPRVLRAIRPFQAQDAKAGRGQLSVDAIPNSRILNIRYSSLEPGRAASGAKSAAEAMAAGLASRYAEQGKLSNNSTSLLSNSGDATTHLSSVSAASDAGAVTAASVAPTTSSLLLADRIRIGSQARPRISRGTLGVSDRAATILSPIQIAKLPDRWNVALSSGGATGLLVGCALSTYLTRRGTRLGRLHPRRTVSELNLLSLKVSSTGDDVLFGVNRWMAPMRPVAAYLAMPGASSSVRQFATQLNFLSGHKYGMDIMAPGVGVALVADDATRTAPVLREVRALKTMGVSVLGIIIATR